MRMHHLTTNLNLGQTLTAMGTPLSYVWSHRTLWGLGESHHHHYSPLSPYLPISPHSAPQGGMECGLYKSRGVFPVTPRLLEMQFQTLLRANPSEFT
jgi:hypothetical protein